MRIEGNGELRDGTTSATIIQSTQRGGKGAVSLVPSVQYDGTTDSQMVACYNAVTCQLAFPQRG
jgi:hypothetical protein